MALPDDVEQPVLEGRAGAGIERGERNLALRNIERIAQALDMKVSQLFEGI